MFHVAVVTSRVMKCQEHVHNFGSVQGDNARDEDLSTLEGTDGYASILFGTCAKQFHTEI